MKLGCVIFIFWVIWLHPHCILCGVTLISYHNLNMIPCWVDGYDKTSCSVWRGTCITNSYLCEILTRTKRQFYSTKKWARLFGGTRMVVSQELHRRRLLHWCNLGGGTTWNNNILFWEEMWQSAVKFPCNKIYRQIPLCGSLSCACLHHSPSHLSQSQEMSSAPCKFYGTFSHFFPE